MYSALPFLFLAFLLGLNSIFHCWGFFYPLGVWDSFLLCHSPLFVFLLSIFCTVGYFLAFVHERNKIK